MGTGLLAMVFRGEVAARCPMSGPSHGFGLRSELGLAATPGGGSPPLETHHNPLKPTDLSRKNFKCILGALKLLSRELTAQNLVD